ncbi:hypothetical protein ACN24L_27645 [Streptomyces microflavus]
MAVVHASAEGRDEGDQGSAGDQEEADLERRQAGDVGEDQG